MKKLCLYLSLFLFIAISAFAGENIIGGGYFGSGPGIGGGDGAEYAMNTTGCSLSPVGLTGQTFTYTGTNRTYIDCSGAMQTASANTPRVESNGLLLEPAGANICLQSRNFDTSPWNVYCNLTQDQIGVDGTANKAWSAEDDDNGITESFDQYFDISPTNPSFTFSIFIKKDSDTSRFPEFQVVTQGGGGRALRVQFNTSTGATYIRTDHTGLGAVTVKEYDDWWLLIMSNTDTGNNNTFYVRVQPAATTVWESTEGSAQGTIIVDAAQVEIDKTYPSSYIDNDGVAAGSDLATDGDCSGGTLSMGTGWTHDAGNDEYDATASTANLSEGGILTVGKIYRIKTVWGNITGGSVQIRVGGAPEPGLITANGTYYHYAVATSTVFAVDAVSSFTGSLQSYEIVEIGTVRTNEAGALTYDLPSDLFAETLGGEEVSDGDFATGVPWDYATGWSYDATNDEADCDGTQVGATNLSQVGIVTIGKLYKLTFTVKNRTAGALRIYCGWPNDPTIDWISANGTYTFYVAAAGNNTLYIQGDVAFVGSVDDVSMKEVTNAYDSGDGLAPPHGTAIVWWKPGYAYDDVVAANSGVVAVRDYMLSLFYNNGSLGDIGSDDGTSTAIVDDLNWPLDGSYKLVIKYGYLTSKVAKMKLGYDSGGGVTYTASALKDYDGAFTTGANLIIGYTLAGPIHIKRLRIYEQILTDEEIDATPAP